MAAQAKLTPPLQKTEWNDKINPIIRETGCFALRISRVEAASEDTTEAAAEENSEAVTEAASSQTSLTLTLTNESLTYNFADDAKLGELAQTENIEVKAADSSSDTSATEATTEKASEAVSEAATEAASEEDKTEAASEDAESVFPFTLVTKPAQK